MAAFFDEKNAKDKEQDLDMRYRRAIERTMYRLAHPIFSRDPAVRLNTGSNKQQ